MNIFYKTSFDTLLPIEKNLIERYRKAKLENDYTSYNDFLFQIESLPTMSEDMKKSFLNNNHIDKDIEIMDKSDMLKFVRKTSDLKRTKVTFYDKKIGSIQFRNETMPLNYPGIINGTQFISSFSKGGISLLTYKNVLYDSPVGASKITSLLPDLVNISVSDKVNYKSGERFHYEQEMLFILSHFMYGNESKEELDNLYYLKFDHYLIDNSFCSALYYNLYSLLNDFK